MLEGLAVLAWAHFLACRQPFSRYALSWTLCTADSPGIPPSSYKDTNPIGSGPRPNDLI